MSKWEIIGLIASMCTAIQLIPEVLKALKNKHLDEIAWGMLFFVVFGQVLWFIYGLYFSLLPVVLGAIVHGFMGSFLAILKVKYQRVVVTAEK